MTSLTRRRVRDRPDARNRSLGPCDCTPIRRCEAHWPYELTSPRWREIDQRRHQTAPAGMALVAGAAKPNGDPQ